MKSFLISVILLSSSLVQAETIKDRVHSIEGNLMKFKSGRVAFLNSAQNDLQEGDLVEVELDDRASLISTKLLKKNASPAYKLLSFNQDEPFEPTTINGMNEAWNIFNRSNSYYKRISECSDRAHIWGHDEFKANGTKSMKAFVFFTASYINRNRFKWWFHVAPMYPVMENGVVTNMVMDFRYMMGPATVKEWTDQFVFSKRDCKVTDKFSEYDVNPQTEDCYLMFDSMHYRLPAELQAKENNVFKTQTSEAELKASRSWAFQN